MKFRAFISLFITFIFLGMTVTGVMSYFKKYDEVLSAFHVIFSLTFLFLALFHICNNHKPLRGYFTNKKFRVVASVVVLLTAVVTVGVSYSFFPFNMIVDFGKDQRNQGEVKKKTEYVITTKSEATGKSITVDFKAGSEYVSKTTLPNGYVVTSIPQVAVWVEDAKGTFLETLYVSGKSATGDYSDGKNRRPGALPVWSHARGVKSADGLFMPDKSSSVVDGLTGATPLTSFSVVSKYPDNAGLKVMIEINKSFDFNDHFNKKNITNDPVYSKSPNGQPSLVYTAVLKADFPLQLATLVGHGHISGGDGLVNPDLSKFTTALDIFKGIVVETE